MPAPTGPIRDMVRQYTGLPAAVHILCLGSFINRAGSFVMVFLTIYVSEQLGLGITFATQCFGVFGLGSIVASLVGGQLADRYGRRSIMLVALLGGAAVLLMLGTVRDRATFLMLVLLFALTMEMYRPAAAAMLGDLVKPAQRPHAFGLMYIAFNLGFAFAAPIGGYLARWPRWLFWGDALTTAVYGVIVIWFIRETRPAESQTPSAGKSESNGHVPWSQAARHIVHDTTFLLFSLAALLTSVVFMQAFSTLPIYMRQLGYGEREVGFLLATNGVVIVLCQLPITHTLSRFNRMAVILAGEILLAAGFGLTTFATTAVLLLLTIVIWTLGEVVQASFTQSLVADLAPPELRARYMGVFSLCHAAGLMIGAPLGGRVLDQLGSSALWSSCFVVLMVAATVYGMVYLRLLEPGRSTEARL